MDEKKRSSPSRVKWFLIISSLLIVGFSCYSLLIYREIEKAPHPTKCFTTKMFQVKLCSTSPDYIPYKLVPKHLFQALVLAEDASFYAHQGLDWHEIKESFRRNWEEWRFARGGSTLTQQLAKNLYLSKRKTLDRKIKEYFLAKRLEKNLSKSQILEKYINVVEFGKGLFGIKKAAQFYFNKTPDELNLLESVYIVSLLPSPARLSQSFENKALDPKNQWRMKIILRRLYRSKKIDDEMYIYLKMLIETEAWPFYHFSPDFFSNGQPSIEDEILQEMEDFEPHEPRIEPGGEDGEKKETDSVGENSQEGDVPDDL